MSIEQPKEEVLYELEGNMGSVGGAILSLVLIVGVAVLVIIFISTLAGQTYQLVESDLFINTTFDNASVANDGGYGIANDTIRNMVGESMSRGFSAYETTTGYVPILVLAVVIGVVLTVVLGFGGLAGGKNNGGAL